jgi:glycosyltransferase involved in cell wall biosynthesis/GT2 family glycosyltransferase
VRVGTVISKAWLAHARALAGSLRAHHPDASLSVLVVDPLEGRFDPAGEPFEVLEPRNLDLPAFDAMSARYDVTELCCALKPAIMRHLLEGDETVVYLDSDVRLYAPLDGLDAAFGSGSFLLTPHLLAPLPDDGREPSDQAIVLAGLFNLGFAAARPEPEALALLQWWAARLETDSRIDPARGLVYDQRWAELMPGLSGHVSVWRDPGVNWGYWRAPTAPITRSPDGLLAGDRPLRSVHFTGVDIDGPRYLSRFDSRTVLREGDVLRDLLDEYTDGLRENGHEETSSWPYSFSRTASGIPVDRLVRELWDRAQRERAVNDPPFATAGEDQFLRWLGEVEPDAEGRQLTRYLAARHAADPALRERYPDPRGSDHEAYLAWVAEQAAREPDGLAARLRRKRGRAARPGLRRIGPGARIGAARDEVVVCIPVYGAVEMLAECLASVLDHTDPAVTILVADDATPDPAVFSLLQELETAGRLEGRELVYMRQVENLGFPENVNAGFAAAAPADVVILNSDCVVAAGWLDGLQRAARSDALVATASALTNNGTILSVPSRNHPQPGLPQGATLARAAAELLRNSLRLYPRLPTAVGHCVLVRRPFDPAFSPGYGEEVDFSQRCLLHGFVHVAADEVLVLHRGGASFGADGKANPVQGEHERIIASRYPYYHRAENAAGRAHDSTLARALGPARRALSGLSATIDARCLGPIITGTQIHTLELIRSLSETRRVGLRVIVPPDLGAHAAAELEGLANVTLVSHTSVGPGMTRTDVAHRPYQVSSSDDLALLTHAGERLLITHQDLIAYRNPGYFAGYPQWQRYQRLTRQALALADRIVFFSHHAAADALREDLIGPERVSVIYIGVDHSDGQEPAREPPGCERLGDAPMLLCLGTDFRHKNRVFALRVLEAMVARHGWTGKLVLAGPTVSHGSSAAEEARFLSTRPELAERLVALPAVDESEKAWLLERCTAVLYPTTFEGFGLVPFEAAAANRPCLFASHTALVETLPAELSTLVRWDADASAAKIVQLLADEQACTHHVRAVRREAARFIWRTTGERLADVYTETAASPAREASRLAADLAVVESERAEDKRKYTELWESLTPDARDLIAPDGPLNPDQRHAIAAAARRPLTRRIVIGPLRLLQRITGRSQPGEPAPTEAQAQTFALHIGFSNGEHMRAELAGESVPVPHESSRDWLPEEPLRSDSPSDS